MLTYLQKAFQDSSLFVSHKHNMHDEDTKFISSAFSDLFAYQPDLEYSEHLDYYLPEFDLDGFTEEDICVHSVKMESCGSCKLSMDLDSTRINDQSSIGSQDIRSPFSEAISIKDIAKSQVHIDLSPASSLKKRPPSTQQTSTSPVEVKPVVKFFSDYDRQAYTRSQLNSFVLKLIDHEILTEDQVSQLDQESLQLLSNFSFMIYSTKLENVTLSQDVSVLNEKISATKEKKKRNEERIKYIFKRVNKILLKQYMDKNGISIHEEGKAINELLFKYFGSVLNKEKETSCKKGTPSYDRFFTLLFKPSNMYRNDLKEVFDFPSYLQAFRTIIESDFISDFKKKRTVKIDLYLNDLKNEIFYSNDRFDPSILKKRVSRLPWSIAEVQRGIKFFEDDFKMH